MEFLSVFRVSQLAWRKGFACETSARLSGGRSLVRLTDARGNVVENPGRRSDWPLYRARDFLDQMPDRARRNPSKR